jgi:hypothetical protein
MAPPILGNRTLCESPRQKLAQILRDFIESRGGWIMSPLPLAKKVALRFDVRSQDAARICSELGAVGLVARFVTAGLKSGTNAVSALNREGAGISIGRGMTAPCAVSTFEIALPEENTPAQSDAEIVLGNAPAKRPSANSARKTRVLRSNNELRCEGLVQGGKPTPRRSCRRDATPATTRG